MRSNYLIVADSAECAAAEVHKKLWLQLTGASEDCWLMASRISLGVIRSLSLIGFWYYRLHQLDPIFQQHQSYDYDIYLDYFLLWD